MAGIIHDRGRGKAMGDVDGSGGAITPLGTLSPLGGHTADWTVTVHAPVIIKRSRKTGKRTKRNPWMNANDRDNHWSRRHELTAMWRGEAAQALADAGIPPQERVRITATVHKTRANISDAGNYYKTAKACVDGFIDAGLLPDDNDYHLTGPDMRGGKPGEPRLVFTITKEETK